ncbi:hypothetical protein [Nocardia sp. NBC_01329]|uniref:hypothetical protein n=1 Tax=Nocardia sp. NBC_01329 TaxID=2903594 RepID=UPI002E0F7784|nr:hypothetical protein OG405_07945 [Nocardia sp. NBC_01329]
MTHHETARVRADRPPVSGADLEADPLVVTVRRFHGFLRAGWRFQAGLAGRMPQLFLAGGSL